ncbi:MAG: hypothetical protein KJO32_04165, partial [Deltaproteobacteria bacterium]|nr:hypothetical protein [Deltaproteobacteria bacterium]
FDEYVNYMDQPSWFQFATFGLRLDEHRLQTLPIRINNHSTLSLISCSKHQDAFSSQASQNWLKNGR